MELSKIFKFGGIYQSGNRMATPLGTFRPFTNAFKDKTGRILPFGNVPEEDNEPSTVSLPVVSWEYPIFSAVFKGAIVEILKGEYLGVKVGALKYFRKSSQNIEVAQVFGSNHLINLDVSSRYSPAGNFTSAIVNNKLFICEYVNQSEFDYAAEIGTVKVAAFNLLKFDGIQICNAGLPTPYITSTPDPAGTRRIRTLHFSIGLDAEVIFSNYLETQVAVNGSNQVASVFIGAYTDAAATVRRSDAVGTSGNAFPAQREPKDYLFDDSVPRYYNKKWLLHNGIGDISYTVGTGLICINCSKASPDLAVGDWLLSVPNHIFIARVKYDAYYLRLKSIVGTTYTFEPKIKCFNGFTASWEDWDLDDGSPQGGPADFLVDLGSRSFSNIQALIYASQNAGGTLPYELVRIEPVLWDSNEATGVANLTPGVVTLFRPLLGVINPLFSDTYDHTIVKTTFPPVKGITNYSNLLIGFDANALYFQDTSLGGSTEMVSGISNIVPYGSEYGEIVAVCGSENFLLISRERKNYILTGELTTGNVNITECDSPVSGAANAKAVSNAFSDKVIFMNETGIYAVGASGDIKEISEPIRDLFYEVTLNSTRVEDGNLFESDVFKSKNEKLESNYDGGFFHIFLEERRGFICFLTGRFDNLVDQALVQSNFLIYDTNDGSWYEFYGNGATTAEALSGTIFSLGETLREEGGLIYPDAPEEEQMLLLTQWMTFGQPSIEKQVLQAKFYGYLQHINDVDDNPVRPEIKIGHQTQWQKFDGIDYDEDLDTYVTYPAADDRKFTTSNYVHKQRLDSSKAQAFSVLFKTVDGEMLTLEGMEIELSPIQDGVKK